eukprot:9033080-Alexandrium_andersonii.AAC.1
MRQPPSPRKASPRAARSSSHAEAQGVPLTPRAGPAMGRIFLRFLWAFAVLCSSSWISTNPYWPSALTSKSGSSRKDAAALHRLRTWRHRQQNPANTRSSQRTSSDTTAPSSAVAC